MLKRVVEYFANEFNAIRNGRVFVFLVCLALASFLWILNALEKRYTDHITVPLKYINLPENKTLTGKLPARLDLTVDGYGYTLLQYKLNLAVSPVLIDVNELTGNYLEAKYMSRYSISTNGHKEQIAKQISSEIVILSIRPDSMSFHVSNVIEKLVKIHPVVDLNFEKEYLLQKPPVAIPESVLVRGSQDILDTLKYINTLPIELKNLSHTTEKVVHLDLLPELRSEIKEVRVQILVEQYTEVKFEIPVIIVNQPDSLLIKTFPAKVKVSCRVGLSRYNNLNSNSFGAIVDYSNRNAALSKLRVTLNRVPDNALFVDHFPKEVEYIIERR